MSQYCYHPLSKGPDTIRLLRLLPSENETAEIRVELFEYRLQISSKRNHLYEALSYSWGGQTTDHGQSILIGDQRLDITPNLHAALMHFRDCGLPRILWIDAICINQADDEEKAQQIQYMVTIYGKASQVLIWLGLSADNSDEVLEALRAAGKDSVSVSKEKSIEESITSLLQRAWFRRVWVLQEVAAARRILIMCGNIEIDGHTFCAGLERFSGAKKTDFVLHRQVHALIYLIRQATHRPQLVLNRPGRASLDICSLGELIDMYHNCGATKRHDKIYALLGMSTDDLSESGLLPDYRTPWQELMQRLIRHILGRRVSAKVGSEEESTEINGQGCVTGIITRIEDDGGKQKVSITSNQTYGHIADGSFYWDITLPATADHVQIGDIVCQLQGAPKPMIIRPCDGYWNVVVVMLVPPKRVRIKSFPRDFCLLWDWKSQPVTEVLSQKRVSDDVNRVTRLWDMGMILKDAGEHTKAEEKVVEAIQTFQATPTKADDDPITEDLVTETIKKFGSQVVALLYKNMWDKIDLPNLWTNIVKRQDEEVIALILHGHPDGCKVLTQEQGLWFAARNKNPKVLSLLLNQPNKSEVHISESIVAAAVHNFDSALEMLSVLLQERKDEVKITEEVIQSIVYMSHAPDRGPGKKIMMLLLETKGMETHFTDEMVARVVSMFDQEVVQLLFDQHRDEIEITDAVVVAAAGNASHEIEVLTILLGHDDTKAKITETLLEKVDRSFGRNKDEVMRFLLNRLGKSSTITEPMVIGIVDHFNLETVELLFDLKGDEIQITESIVTTAASKWDGVEVFRFLLNRAGDDLPITEGMLEAAARSSDPGQLEYLLLQRESEIQITEAVLQAAIKGNIFGGPNLKLILDFDDTIQISEAVAEAAANTWHPMIGFLLERKRGAIQITGRVLEAAVKCNEFKNEVIQSLLNYDVRVTESILAVAAANEKDSSRLALLLDRRGDEIKITEAVIHAVLSNWDMGEEIMDILLDRKRDDLLEMAQTTADDDLREKLSYWVPKKSNYSFECFTWIPSGSELSSIEWHQEED